MSKTSYTVSALAGGVYPTDVVPFERTEKFLASYGLEPLLGPLVGCLDIPDDTAEWLKSRRGQYFGGSEAGSLLNISKYKGRWTLWAEHSDLLPLDLESSEEAKFGSHIESYLLQSEMDRLNAMSISDVGSDPPAYWIVFSFKHTFFHDEVPFLAYSPDGIAVPYIHGEPCRSNAVLLECKAASAYHRDDWDYMRKHGRPRTEHERNTTASYFAQLQLGLEVFSLVRGRFVYLLDNRPQTADVRVSLTWSDRIKDAASSMWNSILHKDQPPITKPDEPYVSLVRKEGSVDRTDLSVLAAEYAEVSKSYRFWEKRKTELRRRLLAEGSRYQSVNFGRVVGYWQTRKGGIDSEKLERDYPAVYDAVKKPESRSFTLRVKKKEECDE